MAEAQRLSHTGSWAGIPKTGEHTYWSEEAFRVLGFDPARRPPPFEELQQRFHPDDRARATEHFRRAIRDKVGFDVSYRIVHSGGEIREIHSIGHPVSGPTGDLLEVVGTVMDVTERRRAEEERQALVHANRITTMGQLTASIAHEIKQPIAAVPPTHRPLDAGSTCGRLICRRFGGLLTASSTTEDGPATSSAGFARSSRRRRRGKTGWTSTTQPSKSLR